MSSKGSTAVGVIVAILIIGAVASIGYYQVEVAPKIAAGSTTSTSSTAASVDCASTPSECVNVTITSGASSPYSGYTQGSATLYGYSPTTITVVIGVNNTVVWLNNDTAFHTVTGATGNPDTSFGSTTCLNGINAPCVTSPSADTYQFTFTVPGTYHYHCIYHAWMQGEVIVKAGTSTSSASTSSSSS
jgi:plastocyanin